MPKPTRTLKPAVDMSDYELEETAGRCYTRYWKLKTRYDELEDEQRKRRERRRNGSERKAGPLVPAEAAAIA
jgi:hypothetical protein